MINYKIQGALNELALNSRRTRAAVKTIIEHSDINDIEASIQFLSDRNKLIEELFFGTIRAKNWSGIWSTPSIKLTTNIQKAINFQIGTFSHYSEFIQQHIHIRKKIWNLALDGRWEDVLSTLISEHEPACGKTLWALQWQALAGNELKTDYKKLLADSVKSKDDPGHYFADYCLGFFDVSTSQDYLESHFQNAVSERLSDLKSGIADFLRLLILQEADSNIDTNKLISFISQLPLIDRYELMIALALHGPMNESKESSKLIRMGLKLSTHITDPILENALDCTVKDSTKLSTTDRAFMDAWGCYISGDYPAARDKSKQLLKTDAEYFPIHELFVKSCLYSESRDEFNGKTPKHRLWQNLANVYLKNDDSDDGLHFIHRFGSRFRIPPISQASRAFHSLHSSAFPKKRQLNLAAIAEGIHNPRKFDYTEKPLGENYLERLSACDPACITIRFFRLAERCSDEKYRAELDTLNAPTIRKDFFIGLASFRAKNAQLCEAHLKKFLKTYEGDSAGPLAPFATEEARRILITIHLATGRLEPVFQVLSTAIQERSTMLRRLPLNEIYNQGKLNISQSCSHPEFVLLSHLTQSDPHKISLDLKRFLKHKGARKPSDIFNLASQNPSVYATLFLRAATPEILDSFIELNTPSKVETERISLLEWVIKNHKPLSRPAENEILRLAQTSQLNKALLKIEGSKVVLNIPALLEAEDNQLSETYYKYEAKVGLSLSRSANKLMDAIDVARRSDHTQQGQVIFVDYDSGRAEFSTAFSDILELFLKTPHFGLEACLSSRIRHGVINQHIRKPLVENRLAYRGETPESRDTKNEWSKHISTSNIDIEGLENILGVLRKLTIKIDSVAEDVKNKWIQSKTDHGDSTALFDFCFSERDLAEIHVQIAPTKGDIHDKKQFMDVIFNSLVKRTKQNLRTVQTEISKTLRANLLDAVETAIREMPAQPSQLSIHVKDALVRSRHDFERATEQMIRWFDDQDPSLLGDADLDLVARTAVGMAERLNPEYNGRHTIDAPTNIRIKGRHFTTLVHMLFFLIDNSIKYSSCAAENYSGDVKILPSKSDFTMRVSNKMPAKSDAKSACTKINDKVAETLIDFDPAKVVREGGTGFSKILAAIRYEFKDRTPKIEAHAEGEKLIVDILCKLPSYSEPEHIKT